MSSLIYHVGATAMCPHAGSIQVVAGNTRVLLSGQPTATLADNYPISGCPFTTPEPKPQPCVTVQWLGPATRVFADGQPVILQNSSGICKSAEQIPQGSPSIVATQTRVRGS